MRGYTPMLLAAMIVLFLWGFLGYLAYSDRIELAHCQNFCNPYLAKRVSGQCFCDQMVKKP